MSIDFPSLTTSFHTSVYPAIDPTRADLSAKGKSILITGGSRGIGKAIAMAFASAGARAIAILGRNIGSLEAAAKEIRATSIEAGNNTTVRPFAADICDLAALSQSFKAIQDDFYTVDVVINNAADIYMGTIESSDPESYWKSFEINVKGTLNCMQAFRYLRTGQNGSSVITFINMSTIGIAMSAMPTWSSYAASKLAAWKMVEHFKVEEGDAVRVFSIHPGRIATEMTEKTGIPTPDDAG